MRNLALIHRVVVVVGLKVLAARQTERALPVVAQPPERVLEQQLLHLSVPAPHLLGSVN